VLRLPILPLILGSAVAAISVVVLVPATVTLGPASAAAVVYLTASLIILSRIRAFHPYPRFGAANAITLARLALVCAFVAVAVGQQDARDWTLFAAGMCMLIADGMDGWLARRMGIESRFGARFDMETDAFFVLVLSIIAWRVDKAGAWILLSGAARYLYVAAGAVLPVLCRPLEPSFRRKTVAVIQMGGLVALLAPIVQPPLSDALALGALIALLYSFGTDIVHQVRHA
jgi:phosphatidylglycerophosphate synthase